MILCSNPHAEYLALQPQIDAAVARVMQSGWYILGSEVRAFEDEFAACFQLPFAVGVANGTDALHLALRACGIGPGDEVITVSHTAVATVAAIEMSGATPVLADIDPHFYTLQPECAAAAITPRTKALLPVHLYGHPCDMPPLMELAARHGLKVIEDCSQSHGAQLDGQLLGTFGDAACFSLYPTKNLGCLGDGGIVATRDSELAQRLRELREYGWRERYISHVAGFNSRLDELQAAILRVKLQHLFRHNELRRAHAARYDRELAGTGLVLPRVLPEARPVYHLYVVRSPQRDRLLRGLKERGVAAGIHYPLPVHLQPAYANRLPGCDLLGETERICRDVLSLPMSPHLSEADQTTVIEAVRALV